MTLPAFTETGDLPAGVYPASLDEVIERFGAGTTQRQEVTGRLRRICTLASSTMALDRVVVFGSYVTAKLDPNDVDVILVMTDAFAIENCPAQAAVLFDHQRANRELAASVFWVRPGMLLRESLETFIGRWQMTRAGGLRGIVEIRP